MRVLLIGSGGREHALAHALKRSSLLTRLWVAPGNGGTAPIADNVELAGNEATLAFARAQGVELVVVGPEAPLAEGLADALMAAGVPVWGPVAAAAQLETSKGFTKDLCARLGVPTAPYRRFADPAAARDHAATAPLPMVIKADGLAAGKGVVVAHTREEALAAAERLGTRGELVIEGFLEGEEASLFALVDGATVIPFGSARDYKRLSDGDEGPNTGGMGALSPAPALTPELEAAAFARIVRPVAEALVAAGTPYRGFLYAGLMLTAGGPQLIEFNARLGDPEAQALLPRLSSDLLAHLRDGAAGRLAEVRPEWDMRTGVTVVVAARGYPERPAVGGPVGGIAAAEAAGATVYQAGTGMDARGALLATGGRVLAVTALGADAAEARARAYAAVDRLDYRDAAFRRDIAAPPPPAVLFVCLGNICRSPLAEGVFTRAAKDAGLSVRIDSAGTGDWHIGRPPDPRAQAVAEANGVTIAHLRARQVRPEDFRRFTHIVAMDRQNLRDLEALRPTGAPARLSAFMDYAPRLGLTEVPDPYYGEARDFEHVWALVREAADGLVEQLKR